ncbi:hypothetical protein CEUSTIGMA_g1403.t1 [Chlamydomonas eustigma]|uniref:AAA+ ATPase domain-containing protein n=1 Tax=Chlamydomonas eustigma TaxID=1157962 RepID=A0A250WT07_9CHLO|nr:hypothetical protein CEUSTIGMA_g1403.t1 [Chlamydomonas eustigma]|eukprot:GAX73953.1 hypothetical protein CEUSTIGMA_g1403.t1 [Chlamydomonas eustigma]
MNTYKNLGGAILRRCFHSLKTNCESIPFILEEYDRGLRQSLLKPDTSQADAVKALHLIQQYLQTTWGSSNNYRPLAGSTEHCTASTEHASEAAVPGELQASHISGAYLWGPVGSGKTMCMNLFYRTLPLSEASSFTIFQGEQQLLESPPSSSHLITAGESLPSSSASSATDTCESGSQSGRLVGKLGSNKRRLHFHEFMLQVHQRLHTLQQSRSKVIGKSRFGLPVYRYAEPQVDPLDRVVMEIATSTRVLCLDELHVTDVADAMILARLLEGVLYHGTLVVFTSNRPPKDLYKGGLSRKYFEPFIEVIEDSMAVVRVGSGMDYRSEESTSCTFSSLKNRSAVLRERVAAAKRAVIASTHTTDQGLLLCGSSHDGGRLKDTCWASATRGWQKVYQKKLQVSYGRTLSIPLIAVPSDSSSVVTASGLSVSSSVIEASGPNSYGERVTSSGFGDGAAYFCFEQLCGEEGLKDPNGSALRTVLGASDYLQICRTFPIIFIANIPEFKADDRDAARRFVTLLDVLYEEACCLICSAQVPPNQLFQPLLELAKLEGVNPSLGRSQKVDRSNSSKPAAASVPSSSAAVAGYGRMGERPPGTSPTANKALLQEEVIMYHRASSRLTELCQVSQN